MLTSAQIAELRTRFLALQQERAQREADAVEPAVQPAVQQVTRPGDQPGAPSQQEGPVSAEMPAAACDGLTSADHLCLSAALGAEPMDQDSGRLAQDDYSAHCLSGDAAAGAFLLPERQAFEAADTKGGGTENQDAEGQAAEPQDGEEEDTEEGGTEEEDPSLHVLPPVPSHLVPAVTSAAEQRRAGAQADALAALRLFADGPGGTVGGTAGAPASLDGFRAFADGGFAARRPAVEAAWGTAAEAQGKRTHIMTAL